MTFNDILINVFISALATVVATPIGWGCLSLIKRGWRILKENDARKRSAVSRGPEFRDAVSAYAVHNAVMGLFALIIGCFMMSVSVFVKAFYLSIKTQMLVLETLASISPASLDKNVFADIANELYLPGLTYAFYVSLTLIV